MYPVPSSHSETFRAIFEHMPVGIGYVSLEGKWLLVNPKLCETLQHSQQELACLTYMDLTFFEDLAQDHFYSQRFLAKEITSASFEKRFLRKDGSTIWTHMTVSLVLTPSGSPSYFAMIVEDIETHKQQEHHIEHLLRTKQTQQALTRAEEMNQYLQVLQTITDTALTYLGLDDLFREMLRRINEIFFADTIAILLLTDDRKYLTIRAAKGLEEEIDQDVHIPVGKGFAGRIAAQCRPLVVPDIDQIEVVSEILRKNVRSLMGVPLLAGDKIIGVIHIGTKYPRHFTARDVELFQRVADRIARAIDYASLYQAEQQARAQAVIHARQLEAINEQLEEANKRQRAFTSIIGHEIRTPLAGIQGFSELLRDGEWSMAEVKEFAADIYGDAKRLNRIISEFLDLERMQSGRMSLNTSMVQVNILLSDIVGRTQTSTQNHTFKLQLDEQIPQIPADEDKLTQVMTNLLSNAIKYSPNGGEVLVTSQLEDEHVHIQVQDHGLGIPDTARKKLFTPFYRIESASTRYIQGTGLGLSIVKEIIEMHQGKIWVESTLGEGSTFHIVLPCTQPNPPHV